MKAFIDYNNIPNLKVKIYAETAKQIFIKCFKKAELIRQEEMKKKVPDLMLKNTSNKYYLLASVLDLKIENSPIQDSFVRKKSSKIEQLIMDGKQHELVGFDHHHLLTLSVFAEIPDYDTFNAQFGPLITFPIVFNTVPFKWFNIIRIPKAGLLTEKDSHWVLADAHHNKIERNVLEASPFTMPGDRDPLWIAVQFNHQDILQTIYFAEDTGSTLKTVDTSSSLLNFFRSLITRS